MSNNEYSFGIDLGTTNSLISYYLSGDVHIIEIDGEELVPSLVAIDEDQNILVGKSAQKYAEIFPENVIFSNKRNIGDNKSYLVNGVSISSIEVSSEILSYLVQNAEKKLNIKVTDVVITVPAYFNDQQRKNTIISAQNIGLNVIRLVNEPTAASLAYRYLIQNKSKIEINETYQNWLVYDLGGGTFDVSIIKVQQNGHNEVIVSMGDNFLGGDDFDSHILNYLKNKILSTYGGEISFSRKDLTKLRMFSEKIKWSLSSGLDVVEFSVSSLLGQNFEEVIKVKNKVFESLVASLIDKTLQTVDKTLEMAHLTKDEINKLIFVGGSTEIPVVKKRVEAFLGLKSFNEINPHVLVAMGAAIQASISKGINFNSTVIDIAPHSLGLAVIGEFDDKDFFKNNNHFSDNFNGSDLPLEVIQEYCKKPPKTFVPVIEKMSKLPAVFVKKFYIGHDNQRFIPLAIYQGESCYNDENSLVGVYVAEFEALRVGEVVKVEMRYDLNGTVSVKLFIGEVEENTRTTSFKLNLYDKNGEVQILEKNSSSNDSRTERKIIKNEIINAVEKESLGADVDDLLKEYMGFLVEGNNENAEVFERHLKLLLSEADNKNGE